MEYFLPYVVHLKRSKGQIVQGCDVYIARRQTQGGWNMPDSIWANEFPVKKYGMDDSLRMYEADLITKINNNPAYWNARFSELVNSGKRLSLGCWCKNKGDGRCHGDVIVKFCQNFISDFTEKKIFR
tara:strand:- start:92644 stop:93024 length:381 start_codon:yes stop_codon:yes gene_type:complete